MYAFTHAYTYVFVHISFIHIYVCIYWYMYVRVLWCCFGTIHICAHVRTHPLSFFLVCTHTLSFMLWLFISNSEIIVSYLISSYAGLLDSRRLITCSQALQLEWPDNLRLHPGSASSHGLRAPVWTCVRVCVFVSVTVCRTPSIRVNIYRIQYASLSHTPGSHTLRRRQKKTLIALLLSVTIRRCFSSWCWLRCHWKLLERLSSAYTTRKRLPFC